MLEMFSDLTTLWISVVMTVLFVAAFTRANVLLIEWELRTNWKNRLFVDLKEQKRIDTLLIPLSAKRYHPKIPSRFDHSDQDEEDPTPVVFSY